ncbi:MAG: hypothetical protein KIS66_01185 [Fimbriimonadaceae bacterium]|nr:hypothetical protein [Fimbriimonadaceae bacterium]
MWFDASEPQRAFEDGIFGFNPWGFAYFLEPDGFRSIQALRGPRLDQYEKFVPRTLGIARAMYGTIHQRHTWGTQIAPGRWSYERLNAEIKTPKGTRRGNIIQLGDVLKHLCGRSRYARGTTDVPVQFYSWKAQESEWRPNFVPCLRLDIDLDRAWFAEDDSEVVRELVSQRQVVEATSLPYRVFRTGSRGVQVVIPLPLSVPPSLASALMHGIRSALEERGRGFTNPDKDNLHSLMRLPGGLHASSENLGLWIDVDEGRLYPLEVQAEMMAAGFGYPDDQDVMTKETFQKAGSAMLNRITASGVAIHELLDRDAAMLHLRARPANPIAQAIEAAHEEARVIRAEREAMMDEWRKTWLAPSPPPTEAATEQQEKEHASEVAETILEGNEEAVEVRADAAAPVGTVEWAKAVWLEAYPQGGHWEWVNMGGRKGILAAVILFGSDRAEEAMLTLSRQIGARSATEMREREFTIRRLWETFGMKNFVPYKEREAFVPPLVLGPSTPEVEELADRILAQMLAAQPKPRWNTALARKLALVLLIGIRDSETGRLRASFGTLSASVNERWPEVRTNRQRVSEMIPRMTQGKATLVRGFFRAKGQKWKSEADEYGCGLFLRGTPLQQEASRKLAEIIERQAVEFGDDDPVIGEHDAPAEATPDALAWDGADDASVEGPPSP